MEQEGEAVSAGKVENPAAVPRPYRCTVKVMAVRLSTGVVHQVPADLRAALAADPAARAGWQDLTPLARNEWICWTISVKKSETRMQHIERLCHDLKNGKRRPCCWPGCPHR